MLAVLRASDADVLVLSGIDYDYGGAALGALSGRLGDYPYSFAGRPNRGRSSGHDLDGDGIEEPIGFAAFAGQGGLAVLSRLPLDTGAVVDLSAMSWTSLPGHIAPPDTPEDLPLSTSAHWILPVLLPGAARLNLLIWHGTPPVFDGPGDRNGRRNHDEAALWLRLLDGALGPPPPGALVVAGFANLDPVDGDGRPEALTELLAHPALQDPRPASEGGRDAALRDGGVNATQDGDPALDTADWRDAAPWPGNLRVDYILPSRALVVTGSGVLWPDPATSLGGQVRDASRHRLVWVDIAR